MNASRWGSVGVVVMAALLALYLVFTVQYSIACITAPEPIAKSIGIALLVLPLIAAWYLVTELRFVVRGQLLLRRLGREGALPADDLPRLPSGRPDPAVAKERFPAFKAEVEADERSWRAWARLSLAYDAAGDRPRAREAMRVALRLGRGSGGPSRGATPPKAV